MVVYAYFLGVLFLHLIFKPVCHHFMKKTTADLKENRFAAKVVLVISLTIIVSAALSILHSSNCHAASEKEIYLLEEQCGKKAHTRFAQRNGIIETKKGMMVVNYTYHYNKKMNKCFVLLETTNYANNEALSNIKELWDINEDKNYGKYFKYVRDDKPLSCKVTNKKCTSEYLWIFLIRPYMEE